MTRRSRAAFRLDARALRRGRAGLRHTYLGTHDATSAHAARRAASDGRACRSVAGLPLAYATLRLLSCLPRPVDCKDQVLATRTAVDAWVQRASSLEEPQPGSDLESDDRIFPARRVSETARLALIASSEHLQLACQVVDGPRGYATALHTVLRGALLGAATAVWLVGPSDPHERQQRALRHAREWYRRMAQYSETCRPHCPPQDVPRLDEQIDHAKEQAAAVRGLWRASSTLTADHQPRDTEIIGWVADFLFATDLDRATTIRRDWAEHSGDAHALGWQLVTRRTSPMRREPGVYRITMSQADVDRLADPYLAAFAVLRRGWSYFDQRCTGG